LTVLSVFSQKKGLGPLGVKELAKAISTLSFYYDNLLIPREYIVCRGVSNLFKYDLFEGRK